MYFMSSQDIHRVITALGKNAVMDAVINALSSDLQAYDPAKVWIPTRQGFNDIGLTEWMPVHIKEDSTTIKIVSYFPSNPSTYNKSTIQAMLARFDSSTGQVMEVAEGTLLTALRTGAASAIATQILACPKSKTLGLVGCGAQSIMQAHAICRLFPIEKIIAFDVCPAAHASIVKRLSFLKVSVQPVGLDRVEAEADILCTATTLEVDAPPVINGAKLKPNVHINAVGSDYPGKRELPADIVKSSFIVPDHLGQAITEGECQHLDDISQLCELYQIVQSPEKFKRYRENLTIFDSTGLALEDASVLTTVGRLARSIGVGQELEFESDYLDPKDLYGGIRNNARCQKKPLVMAEL